MALIPDLAVLSANEITPAAFGLYAYYCMKRNRKSGGYHCPSSAVLQNMKGITEPTYFRLRRELVDKGWIRAAGNFVQPIMGFDPIKNNSTSSEIATRNDSDIEARTIKNDGKAIKSDSKTIKNDSSLNITTSHNQNTTSSAEVSARPKSDHQLAMALLQETIGPYPNGAAQGKSASWMLKNGFTLDDIRNYLPSHVTGYRAKGFHPSFLTLQKVIGDLKAADCARKRTDYCHRCQANLGMIYLDNGDITRCDHQPAVVRAIHETNIKANQSAFGGVL